MNRSNAFVPTLVVAAFAAATSGLAQQEHGAADQEQHATPAAPTAAAPTAPEQSAGDAAQPAGDAAATAPAAAAEAAAAQPAPNVDAAPAVAQAAEEPRPYTVECSPDAATGATACLVDRDTYVGWRTFHAICHTCHGQDALGSTFAPNLLDRLKQIDKAAYMKAMNEGFTGQMGVMPPWVNDPNVNKYFEELWSYLLARADGVLAPGRPKRLPNPG